MVCDFRVLLWMYVVEMQHYKMFKFPTIHLGPLLTHLTYLLIYTLEHA